MPTVLQDRRHHGFHRPDELRYVDRRNNVSNCPGRIHRVAHWRRVCGQPADRPDFIYGSSEQPFLSECRPAGRRNNSHQDRWFRQVKAAIAASMREIAASKGCRL